MPFLKALRTEIVDHSKKSMNYELRTQNLKARGFTLIEFLVVLGILALTVSSTLLFLTSVLRGSNKANVIAEVKQNGQAVLESLERQIRNGVDAEKVKDIGGAEVINAIKIIRQDQDSLYIKCFPQGSDYNGSIRTVVSESETDPSGYITLTNKDDIVSGVDIACSPTYDLDCGLSVISATAGVTSPPIVSICFYANQGINAPSRQDFEAKVKFQTTISLRRY